MENDMPQGAIMDRSPHSPPYKRHRPEQTLLYQIIERYCPEFRDVMAMQGKALPLHVQQEFVEYLKCGRLEHGFVRVQCSECHHEHLVAFNCKNEASVQAAERSVWPRARHCCAMRFCLNSPFASRPELMGRVLGIVYRAISAQLIQKAGFTRKTAQTGAVTLI
jgi:hypothetical protein